MKIEGKTLLGRKATVTVSGKLIGAVHLADESTSAEPGQTFIGPGLVDLQVNGFAGVDFNHPGLEADHLESACRAMLHTGVGSFFPTLITAGYDRLEHAVGIIRKAVEDGGLVRDMVAGIHLEGPFINPEDGPRGAHPAEHVRTADWAWFQRLQRMSGGLIRLVTLAPEVPGGLDFVGRAAQAGLVAALGHCAPSPETVDAAVKLGARMSTHLGNAAHINLPRHANYIQKQLAHDGLMAGLICDGHHLPDYFVKNAVRAKGVDNIVLVTDATSASGSPPGRYTMGELELESGRDGVLRLSGTPYLAGSTLTLDRAVINCVRFAQIEPAQAMAMAAANPARLFKETGGSLQPGRPANLIRFKLLEDRIQVLESYMAGRLVYTA